MTLKELVENKYFQRFTTFLIVANFVVLVFSTRGHDTTFIENVILMYFTAEVTAKIFSYGWKEFWGNPWNKFDFTIVVVGLLPVLGVPLPSGASGLRAIRVLRLIGVIPAFRDIIGAIGRSLTQMSAVGGITLILLMICTLMATMSFQNSLPELFGSMFTSFGTLLQMAAFSKLEVVGMAWEQSKFGTLLVFPLFFIGVPLMTLNLIIGVLGNALSEEQVEPEDQKQLKKNVIYLRKKIDHLEKLIEKLGEK